MRAVALFGVAHAVGQPFRALRRVLQRVVVDLAGLQGQGHPGQQNNPGDSQEKPFHSLYSHAGSLIEIKRVLVGYQTV